MKVKHIKPRGRRINCTSRRVGDRRIPAYGTLSCLGELWWVCDINKWMKYEDIPDGMSLSSNSKKINSVKAAITHIKRHNEIPSGTKMILESNFVGYNVIITK